MANPKFRVTYEIEGVRLSNLIEPKTTDLYFLFEVQDSVAYDWGRKRLEKYASRKDIDARSLSKLISIEQVE